MALPESDSLKTVPLCHLHRHGFYLMSNFIPFFVIAIIASFILTSPISMTKGFIIKAGEVEFVAGKSYQYLGSF